MLLPMVESDQEKRYIVSQGIEKRRMYLYRYLSGAPLRTSHLLPLSPGCTPFNDTGTYTLKEVKTYFIIFFSYQTYLSPVSNPNNFIFILDALDQEMSYKVYKLVDGIYYPVYFNKDTFEITVLYSQEQLIDFSLDLFDFKYSELLQVPSNSSYFIYVDNTYISIKDYIYSYHPF